MNTSNEATPFKGGVLSYNALLRESPKWVSQWGCISGSLAKVHYNTTTPMNIQVDSWPKCVLPNNRNGIA